MESLPAQRTSFVGRVQEIDVLAAMLLRGDIRIVTLTGPGGIGKTRLAMKVASQVQTRFEQGVRFVPLESILDPHLVTGAIVNHLHLNPPPEGDLGSFLSSTLASSHMLLVLDNFEQILRAAPEISTLLTHCPHLKVLATSRAPLDITGEHTFPVPPLALVDDGAPGLSAIRETEAIRLFVERSTSADPGFALTGANATDIASICRRLDGLPLAIELAASQIRVVPPRTLLQRIDNGRPLPLPGRRDAPERQQSIRETIAWSYDLLRGPERKLFRWLSMFTGGFGLDAAEAVCADIEERGDDGFAAPGGDILPALGSLIANSLVVHDDNSGEARYSMLVSIRAYGLEQLRACHEVEHVRASHARWHLELAERMRWGWMFSSEEMSLLYREHPNMLAALEFFLETADVDSALRMATGLSGFWYVQSLFETGAAKLGAALELAEDLTGILAGRARVAKGMLVAIQGNWEEARTLLSEGMAAIEEADDVATMCLVHVWRGAIANYTLDHRGAEPQLNRALELAKRVPDPRISAALTARTLANLGIAARGHGDVERAIGYHDSAIEINRAHGFTLGVIRALYDRGEAASDQEDNTVAMQYFRECLAFVGVDGDRRVIIDVLSRSAFIAAQWRQPAVATRLLGAADGLRRQLTDFAPSPGDIETRARTLGLIRTQLRERDIERAMEAGARLPLDTVMRLVDQLAPHAVWSSSDEPDAAGLSVRELEVLQMVVDGASNREIADMLFISVRTVEAHIARIREKLGVRSRTAAVAAAIAAGIIAPGPTDA